MCAMREALSPGRIVATAALAAVALVLALTGGANAAGGTRCDVSKDGRKLGTTYVTSLKAQRVACSRAKRVVKAFNACRKANGGARGRCNRRVLGYRCSERRGASIPTQYSSKATCRAGSRVVRFDYTQFT